MDAGGCACAHFRERQREGGRVCLRVCDVRTRVRKPTAFCQRMFDRCQKERVGLIAVMQEDVEGSQVGAVIWTWRGGARDLMGLDLRFGRPGSKSVLLTDTIKKEKE